MVMPQPVNTTPEQPQNSDKTAQWYAANFEFFDLNYDNKTVSTKKAMKHAGRDTIF